MAKTYCIRGHTVALKGRTGAGGCRACVSEDQTRYSERRRAKIAAIKKERGCLRCGYKESSVSLLFHHRDPAEKSFTIAANMKKSWASILAEIAKCDVLCHNCHDVLHEEERKLEDNAWTRRDSSARWE